MDENGEPVFVEDDYKRTFTFFTPWFGSNLNLTRHINVFINYATAQKEPGILDWYDPDKGPRLAEMYGQELKPEKANSLEGGVGFRAQQLEVSANYYQTQYRDKIESVVDINERRTAMNAGRALFQGVECELKAMLGPLDFAGSAMFAKNRWKEMNVWEIFGANAKDVVGKVVPFSPEQAISASLGYRFEGYRLGLRINWWDEYYGTYTNSYTKVDGTVAEAKLPYFFDLSAQFSYTTRLQNVGITFRIDLNNITNRADNFMRAQYTIDYTRNDALAGKYHWYVLQAPLLNAFFTTEIVFP